MLLFSECKTFSPERKNKRIDYYNTRISMLEASGCLFLSLWSFQLDLNSIWAHISVQIVL